MTSRYFILFLSCLLLFGNYYAYDLPASLNTPLQAYLEMDDSNYQYLLNSLYAIYSLPNIFLPFIGGYLIDLFGSSTLTIYLSTLVFIGQLLFATGVQHKSFFLIYLGRIVFGIGGESLFVAQTQMTCRYFKNKELAFALGVNLAIARLGSVANDFLTPLIGITYSIPFAMHIGSLTCFLSFLCGVLLGYIDSKNNLVEYVSIENDSSLMNDLEMDSILPISRNLSINTKNLKRSTSPKPQFISTIPTSSTSPLMQTISSPRRRSTISTAPITVLHIHKGPITLKDSLNFPTSFWLLCTSSILLYATVIPFNTIHSAFLQTKWYDGNPKEAAQVMAIPDLISAIFVPFVGTLVDKYGKRTKILCFCAFVMALCHYILGTATITSLSSPIPCLILLGFAYALLLIYWPCISLVVEEKYLATAIGIATASSNASLTVFPIIVARLIVDDKSYYSTEMFFVGCCVLGGVCCIWLYYVDLRDHNGVLEQPIKRGD